MKRRIAYIGLSYPLLYDYKNQAEMTENDVTDSPNPIIESPLGLMILYDELWFYKTLTAGAEYAADCQRASKQPVVS